MHPKNAWYVACTADEVTDKPLGRQICNEKMVFYRDENQQIAAVEDFCPHRGAPLSWVMSKTANWCAATTAW